VSNSPSFEDDAVLDFFRTSTGNLLAAEQAAGVGHHVALSVVGCDRLPDNGIVEVAGPEPFRFDELIRQSLSARNDPRHVVADPDARYFGTSLGDASLLPGEHAQLGETRFEDWLSRLAIPG
jgi:uncharacterized protein YbjT (DUF2867 family)